MTPKEKAIQIVTDFAFQLRGEHDYFSDAKICALKSIYEIIEELTQYCDSNHIKDRFIYWDKVKQEIIKL